MVRRRREPNVEGFPTHDVAEQSLAEQSGRAHARQRPRVVRQRQGDGAVGHHGDDAESGGRRDSQGCQGPADRPAARESVRPGRPRRGANRADRPRRSMRASRITRSRARRSRKSLSKGITTFEDAGSPISRPSIVIKKMIDEGKLSVRLWVMVRDSNETLERQACRQYKADRLRAITSSRCARSRVRWMARWARAARGCSSRTPTSRTARACNDDRRFRRCSETAQIAMRPRLSAVHPRDRRPRQPRGAEHLRSRVQEHNPNGKDLRWRDRARAAPERRRHPALRPARRHRVDAGDSLHLGCAASSSPASAPQRAEEGAYVWQKLMKSGAVVSNGTDAPVEDVDPIPNYYAPVTRKLKDGTVFYPDQRMSRDGSAAGCTRSRRRTRPSKRTSKARSRSASSPT